MKMMESHHADTFADNTVLMTKTSLREIAIINGGYETPALNDRLYLHFKGFRKIENLDEYKNLKALWLDSNGLQRLENLEHLKNLRCLYLQRNLLSSIQIGLEGLHNLVQLDLSENRITIIDGLHCLPHLESLNLSKNLLKSSKAISHLTLCKRISTLDLSQNNITGEASYEVLTKIPSLISLHVAGNPVVHEVLHFRKRMTIEVKQLRFLDSPIFDQERMASEAWSKGGKEAELQLKKQLNELKQHEQRDSLQDFRSWLSRKRTNEVEKCTINKVFAAEKSTK